MAGYRRKGMGELQTATLDPTINLSLIFIRCRERPYNWKDV